MSGPAPGLADILRGLLPKSMSGRYLNNLGMPVSTGAKSQSKGARPFSMFQLYFIRNKCILKLKILV
jgi:hypothetical protein